MNDHHFNTQIAIDYDIDTAVFLNSMAFWLNKTIANRKNFHEGSFWIYNTYDAFSELFPYWKSHQIKHLISKCLKNGLIIKDNFNQIGYDHTSWYSLTEKALFYYPLIKKQLENALEPKPSLIGEISPMDQTNFSNGSEKFLPAIPVNDPVNDPVNIKPPIIPLEKNRSEFGLQEMLSNNPHDIEQTLIEDWLIIRKQKRAAVTKNCWSLLQRNMEKIKKTLGISPLEQFERMVSCAWTSIQYDYFDKHPKVAPKGMSYEDVIGA